MLNNRSTIEMELPVREVLLSESLISEIESTPYHEKSTLFHAPELTTAIKHDINDKFKKTCSAVCEMRARAKSPAPATGLSHEYFYSLRVRFLQTSDSYLLEMKAPIEEVITDCVNNHTKNLKASTA